MSDDTNPFQNRNELKDHMEKTMADTFEEYLERAENYGVIDFSLRIVRTPQGQLDFYIHPANVSGETGDFAVNGAFVTRLNVGAGSSRKMGSPLLGSGGGDE
jgi:hypothetical protein